MVRRFQRSIRKLSAFAVAALLSACMLPCAAFADECTSEESASSANAMTAGDTSEAFGLGENDSTTGQLSEMPEGETPSVEGAISETAQETAEPLLVCDLVPVASVSVCSTSHEESEAIALQGGDSATMDGIDIASWQKDLDPAAVQADFIIVKATGGAGYTNPYFQNQANATLSAGKYLALYHLANEIGFEGTADEEADYFVAAVQDWGYSKSVLLALDFTYVGEDLDPAWAKQFLDRVHSALGVKPLIYMSKNRTREYDWTEVANAGYELWMAQYPDYEPTGYQEDPWTDSKDTGAWSKPRLFQYACTGVLEGYDGYLNLNKYYGDTWPYDGFADKVEPEPVPPSDDPSNPNDSSRTAFAGTTQVGVQSGKQPPQTGEMPYAPLIVVAGASAAVACWAVRKLQRLS